MNTVIGDRFSIRNREISDGFTRMPRVSRPGIVRRSLQIALGAAARMLQVMNAKNALEIDRVDLGSPECMGCEAWVRNMEGEDACRSQSLVVTDIDRIREAERQVEADITRRRVGALMFVLTMAIGLVGFAAYVSFSADAPVNPVIVSAPRA